MSPTLKPIARAAGMLALAIALASPATAAPSANRTKSQAPIRVTTQALDAYQQKASGEDAARNTAMEKAVALAKTALGRAYEAKDKPRIELCERRLAILTERLDLLRQISKFRAQKYEAEKQGNARAQKAAVHSMEAAYLIIKSHQSEEREIREKLEKSGTLK